jgi:hypothetical protein
MTSSNGYRTASNGYKSSLSHHIKPSSTLLSTSTTAAAATATTPNDTKLSSSHNRNTMSASLPSSPSEFRKLVRSGQFVGPTNNVCPGYLQCNLVVLPQGPSAFDFLLFCQRNPQACPLIDVCEDASACPGWLAPDADLRMDVPK